MQFRPLRPVHQEQRGDDEGGPGNNERRALPALRRQMPGHVEEEYQAESLHRAEYDWLKCELQVRISFYEQNTEAPLLIGPISATILISLRILRGIVMAVRLDPPLILFDGGCRLCNRFVRFVLPRDPDAHFAFAPLQSEFARQRLGTPHQDSIVLVDNGRVLYAEIAVLRILSRLQPPWPWLARTVGLLPGPFLAWGYRVVARHRHRFFGRGEVCMLPQPNWKSRFLG